MLAGGQGVAKARGSATFGRRRTTTWPRGSEALHRSLPNRCLGAAPHRPTSLWSTSTRLGETRRFPGDFIHLRWISLGISQMVLTVTRDAGHSARTPQTEPARPRRGRRSRGDSEAAEPEGKTSEPGATPGTADTLRSRRSRGNPAETTPSATTWKTGVGQVKEPTSGPVLRNGPGRRSGADPWDHPETPIW